MSLIIGPGKFHRNRPFILVYILQVSEPGGRCEVRWGLLPALTTHIFRMNVANRWNRLLCDRLRRLSPKPFTADLADILPHFPRQIIRIREKSADL
jgi:hypothetical protein